MTTVATRIRRLSDLEEFDIIVRQNGQPVDATLNGVMGAWPYAKKSRSAWRVSQFGDEFAAVYGGYTCEVLLEDGSIARGNTLLSNVRESYEEEE